MNVQIDDLTVDSDNRLVTLQFNCPMQPHTAIAILIAGFDNILIPYAYDWLLDFRSVSPSPALSDLKQVAAKWENVAKGRDIGRRTAILYGFCVAESVMEETRKLFPFRNVKAFDSTENAREWIYSINNIEMVEELLV